MTQPTSPANAAALMNAGMAALMSPSQPGKDPEALAREFAGMLVTIGKGLPPEGRRAFRAVIETVLAELDR